MIVAKIEKYAGDPASVASNVKALCKANKDESAVLRLRVGDWRVSFTLAENAMLVTRIAGRGRTMQCAVASRLGDRPSRSPELFATMTAWTLLLRDS